MLYLIKPTPGFFSIYSGTLVSTNILAPHLSQIRFASPNHAQIQNIIVTERPRHHPQNIGIGHAFIPPLELPSKYYFFCHLQIKTICTTLDDLCPNLASAHDFLKNRNKKISYSTKTQILKKNLNQYNYKY